MKLVVESVKSIRPRVVFSVPEKFLNTGTGLLSLCFNVMTSCCRSVKHMKKRQSFIVFIVSLPGSASVSEISVCVSKCALHVSTCVRWFYMSVMCSSDVFFLMNSFVCLAGFPNTMTQWIFYLVFPGLVSHAAEKWLLHQLHPCRRERGRRAAHRERCRWVYV